MNTKILIFDFDGTIADSFSKTLEISNKLAEEFKIHRIKKEEVEMIKNMSYRNIIDYLKIPVFKIPLLVNRLKKELYKNITSIKPVEGLQVVLEGLKSKNYTLGILTSNSIYSVKKFLENNQLDFFDFIESTSKIWSKNTTLNKLIKKNDFPLEKIIYIGDEIRDINAAKKAGVKMISVTWGYNSKNSLKQNSPDHIIDTPKELFETIEKIS